MAFVLGSALTGGRRAGLAAVAGIVAGGILHVAMSAAGIGLVLASAPPLFNALLVAGALYVGWIGWTLWRHAAAFGSIGAQAARTTASTFARAVATCLLNPKAYVFMIAVFPQFIRVDAESFVLQAVKLSAITALIAGGRVRRGRARGRARAPMAANQRPRAGSTRPRRRGLADARRGVDGDTGLADGVTDVVGRESRGRDTKRRCGSAAISFFSPVACSCRASSAPASPSSGSGKAHARPRCAACRRPCAPPRCSSTARCSVRSARSPRSAIRRRSRPATCAPSTPRRRRSTSRPTSGRFSSTTPARSA